MFKTNFLNLFHNACILNQVFHTYMLCLWVRWKLVGYILMGVMWSNTWWTISLYDMVCQQICYHLKASGISCALQHPSLPRERGSVVNIAASGENFKPTLGLKGKRQSWSINTMHTNLTRAGSTCTCYRCWSADVILQVTFFNILSSRSYMY